MRLMGARAKYIVSDKHRFVYFVTPKVACTSIKAALTDLFDLDSAPYRFTLPNGTPSMRVHKLFDESDYQIHKNQLLAGLSKGEYRDYFKFTFVRNPWDRLVSLYFNKVDSSRKALRSDLNPRGIEGRFYPGMPFSEYIEAICRTPDKEANPHFRSQHLVICRQKGKKRIIADFVGRFENLEEDFSRVARQIGAPSLELQHRAKSHRRQAKSLSEFYDVKLRDMVAERFREDIEVFGYSFNGAHSLGNLGPGALR